MEYKYFVKEKEGSELREIDFEEFNNIPYIIKEIQFILESVPKR